MVDSADIYFIQHFADIYFSKSVCISVCGGYQVSFCILVCGGYQVVVLIVKFHFFCRAPFYRIGRVFSSFFFVLKAKQPTRSHLNEGYQQNCILRRTTTYRITFSQKTITRWIEKQPTPTNPNKNIVLCLQRPPYFFLSGTALRKMLKVGWTVQVKNLSACTYNSLIMMS